MPAPLMETIVDRLASASIAIALMVAAAWLACRLRPSLSPSTRSTIWWLVAVAALVRLAPLPVLTLEVPAAWLGGLRPAAPAQMSLEAAGIAATPSIVEKLSRVPTRVAARVPTRAAARLGNQPFVPVGASAETAGGPPAAAPPHAPFDWRTPLVGLWALVACALFARLAIANWRLRRLADAAEARAGRDRGRGRSPRRRPGSAAYAGRPRLRRH